MATFAFFGGVNAAVKRILIQAGNEESRFVRKPVVANGNGGQATVLWHWSIGSVSEAKTYFRVKRRRQHKVVSNRFQTAYC